MSMSSKTSNRPEFYRPRNPEQSPFYKLVNEYFDDSKPMDGWRAWLQPPEGL